MKGLLVEVQYRTLVQHAWATAVEVIGFITENQPKFEEGDERYQHTMALASEILARAFEDATGPFPDLSDLDVVEEFLAADKDIRLMAMLGGLNATNSSLTTRRNTILIMHPSGELDVRSYREATEALRSLFELEKEFAESDVVLVKADTSEEVRLAFKNYFSDARDFIRLVEEGCTKLSGKRVLQSTSRRSGRIRRK